jgi:hypothetical protein
MTEILVFRATQITRVANYTTKLEIVTRSKTTVIAEGITLSPIKVMRLLKLLLSPCFPFHDVKISRQHSCIHSLFYTIIFIILQPSDY